MCHTVLERGQSGECFAKRMSVIGVIYGECLCALCKVAPFLADGTLFGQPLGPNLARRTKFCLPNLEALSNATIRARPSTHVAAQPWPSACACALQKFSKLDLYYSSCAKNIFGAAAQIHPKHIKSCSTECARIQTLLGAGFSRRPQPLCIKTCGGTRARWCFDNLGAHRANRKELHDRSNAASTEAAR